jgi:hypothetical protein
MIDARVPVRFASPGQGAEASAWLAQGDAPVPTGAVLARFSLPPSLPEHPPGCACCVPRGPVARALSDLFLARARGEVAFFREVLAVVQDAAGEAAIRDALARDPVLQARFRLDSA